LSTKYLDDFFIEVYALINSVQCCTFHSIKIKLPNKMGQKSTVEASD